MERARELERERETVFLFLFLFRSERPPTYLIFPSPMVDVDNNATSASQRVVVLDNGGCSIKLGFAGDAHPM